MVKVLVGLVLALGVSGCSGVQPVFPNLAGLSLRDGGDRAWNTDNLTADDYYVCEMEMPTGTHMAMQVCRTPRLLDERRTQAQDLLRLWQQQTIVQDLVRTQQASLTQFRQARPAPR